MGLLLALGFFAVEAYACSCAVSPIGSPPCQSAWEHDAVFTGMVVEITDPGLSMAPLRTPGQPLAFPRRKVRIRVAEAFVGLEPGQSEVVLETGLGGGDCGYGFHSGGDYLVYASKNPNGVLTTGICSPTRPVTDAAEDLKYLHELARLPDTGELRVTAYDTYGEWRLRSGAVPQAPGLEGARVTIDGPVHKTANTDAGGRQVFADLPPGAYTVNALLTGYVAPGASPPVRLHSKGCAEASAPLQLDRVVTGKVFAADGQPASGVTIEAVPVRPRYQNELPTADDSATTDGDGRYELRHLRAGDYYFGVSLTIAPSSQSPYTRWFYPGSEDPAKAGLVHVSDKPEVLRFDLALPRRQNARVFQGVVSWPDGRPAEAVSMILQDPRWPWQTAPIATTDTQGRFAGHGLDGTRYRVHAIAFANGSVSVQPVLVEPGAQLVELKMVLTRPGSSFADTAGKAPVDWRKEAGPR